MASFPIVSQVSGEEFAAEYGRCRERITELLRTVNDETARATTVWACPDWTITGLVSHLAGVPSDLVAGKVATGDTQAWVDAQVHVRRERTLDSLLDEWAEASAPFEAMIAAKPLRLAGLTYDVVVHEHDLRHVLDRPGARDSNGIRVSLEVERWILGRDLAARDLRPVSLVATDADAAWVAGEGDPEVTLTESMFDLLRLTGSRRSERQVLAANWTGPIATYLPAIAHMPLPTEDSTE